MTLSPNPQRPPADDDVGREVASYIFNHDFYEWREGYYGLSKVPDTAALWIEARLTQSETRAGAAAPEGWKLVPIEPTDEWLSEADELTSLVLRLGEWRQVCRALLSAAPPAPQPEAHDINAAPKPKSRRTLFATPAPQRTSAPADALVAALRECVEDLEVLVEAHYASTKHYPSEARRYERDIEPVRKARKALAAHAASSTGAGWRPIETAPKDGTDVLLWWGRRSIGSWFERSVTYDHPCWIVDGGYEKQPTLWQPLPAAPADQGSAGPEWRNLISAPRNGELVKLAWWVGNQFVSTQGRYVRSLACWVDEEKHRLDPKMWAPADQGSAG